MRNPGAGLPIGGAGPECPSGAHAGAPEYLTAAPPPLWRRGSAACIGDVGSTGVVYLPVVAAGDALAGPATAPLSYPALKSGLEKGLPRT